MIDHSQARYTHVCAPPPQILRSVGLSMLDVELVVDHPIGTRHICDVCQRVMVVRWVESQYVNVMPGYEWVPETRRERRRRLGLRWWQRE